MSNQTLGGSLDRFNKKVVSKEAWSGDYFDGRSLQHMDQYLMQAEVCVKNHSGFEECGEFLIPAFKKRASNYYQNNRIFPRQETEVVAVVETDDVDFQLRGDDNGRLSVQIPQMQDLVQVVDGDKLQFLKPFYGRIKIARSFLPSGVGLRMVDGLGHVVPVERDGDYLSALVNVLPSDLSGDRKAALFMLNNMGRLPQNFTAKGVIESLQQMDMDVKNRMPRQTIRR